ncbi:DNA cytosine methyltransferase [Pseudoduganella ginsengisoli]|uniref:DNA (cytosine-5-)-methyltransferase n=1 Tax=Pseudoduganella ginsengisoli TaxID=1462440 RepID=A0A6L6Q780_9BURK|nr:DNA cytosine methyltransferase [Pseudoduganella ginsengisoli]MTW05627.1 DNA (cytosine-5-)-methyltransferase [Pseudoduganella ginsengisoli]
MDDTLSYSGANALLNTLPKINSQSPVSAQSDEVSARTPTVISLFCGAGGLDVGFSQAGFNVVLAVDYFQSAIDTHNHNSKDKSAVKLDLATATATDLHALIQKISPNASPIGIIGGPPCQGFSQANTKRSHSDPRNNLAKNYTKIITQLADIYPIEFFLFENVSGLLSKENEKVLKNLQKTLSSKFTVSSSCLNAKNFHVPQSRERFFMVGLRKNNKNRKFEFPAPATETLKTVRDAIENLPQPVFFDRSLTPKDIPHHPNHWTMRPLSKRFGPDLVSSGRSLIRLNWDKPSRTVAYGHREIHVHPSGLRRLSIYEAMLLQGFPKDYQLCGTLSEQVTQVSNAVPPPLAKVLAESIRIQINEEIVKKCEQTQK